MCEGEANQGEKIEERKKKKEIVSEMKEKGC